MKATLLPDKVASSPVSPWIRWMVCALLCAASHVSAAPAGSLPRYEPGVLYLPDNAIAQKDGYELSIQGVLAGIVLFVIALAFWLRGYYDIHPEGPYTRVTVGFLTMGFVAWLLLSNFEPAGTYGTNRWTVYLVVCLVIATVGAVFIVCTFQLYLMLMGGFGGMAFGLWILGWRDNLSITSAWGRAVLLVLLVLFGIVLSPTSTIFHILGASFAGSYILFLAFDIFFHTGFTYCFTTVFDANPAHAHTYIVYRETYIMQGVMIVAFIVGVVIQIATIQSRTVIQTHHDTYFLKKVYPWPMYYLPFGRPAAPVVVT